MSVRSPLSHAAYLTTEDWQQRRRQALYRAQHRCQSPLCELGYLRSLTSAELAAELAELPRHAYRLEVHHLTYARLGRENPDDLIVLCPRCHAKEHGLEDEPRTNQPVSLQDALITVFARMAERFGKP